MQAANSHIAKSDLEDMFAGIEADTDWNLSGKLVWGYFFDSPDRHALQALSDVLVRDGYTLVELWERESDEKAEKSDWSLHVERVEHHTVETLFARNETLYRLAATQVDVTYDGMDVGPIMENAAKN